ncbi:hypothetical protein BaRGS_00040144 [Batillaria attramentaria]|uniref:Uncharacterized protein n=1 Tax=Batillaria attramentaria TaxID=370345 RepID=A0ABD0J140_9CAEN
MRKSVLQPAKMGHRMEIQTASRLQDLINVGFTLMLLALNFVPITEGIDSSCSISQSGGTSGDLTCKFTEDIGQRKHPFMVLRTPLDSMEKAQFDTILLDCIWVKQGLDCTSQLENLKFPDSVSTSLKLRIPDLGTLHNGSFKCVLVPPDGGRYTPCGYISEDVKDPATTSNYLKSTAKRLPSDDAGNPEKQSTSDTDGSKVALIVLATVVANAIAIVMVLLLIVYIRHRRRAKRRQHHMVPTTEVNPGFEENNSSTNTNQTSPCLP